jgi:hypothetical protein
MRAGRMKQPGWKTCLPRQIFHSGAMNNNYFFFEDFFFEPFLLAATVYHPHSIIGFCGKS